MLGNARKGLPGKFHVIDLGCNRLRNIEYQKNRWRRCLAAGSNKPDNTGYEGYRIIPDIAFYRIKDTESNQIPDSWPVLVHH